MNRSIMATRKPFITEAPPVVKIEDGRKIIIDANAASDKELAESELLKLERNNDR